MEKEFNSYTNRHSFYQKVTYSQWNDWCWQQQNACSNIEQIKRLYPEIANSYLQMLRKWQAKSMQFCLTPYVISLAQGGPNSSDPIWRQFLPVFDELLTYPTNRQDEYSNLKENWEEKSEMLTPICHWKYNNRVIIYSLDTCFAYCNYCLRSVTSTCQNEKHGGMLFWEDTIEQIRKHSQIEEVIISGGDPLLYTNEKIARMLADINSIPSVKIISLNTRVFTHNPFRIDDELCDLFRKYRLIKLGLHIVHPREITDDFIKAIGRLQAKAGQILPLAQIVLLKHVNDDAQILRELFIKLYALGIKPYYLLHNMPNIPSAISQRTSVKKGAKLMQQLKRVISNPAMPEYIIVHHTGKKTIPLDINGSSEFKYTTNKQGEPIIYFKNWQGKWVEYSDGID